LYGPQIGRHVFAFNAISASGAQAEDAVYVLQADCQTIQFQFGGKLRFDDFQFLLDAPNECTNFFISKRVSQGQHWNNMAC